MKSKRLIAASAVIATAALVWVATLTTGGAAEGDALTAQVFELRTYHANAGKLDALHARFREHTNHLFVKHGMKLVGYWTPVEQDADDQHLVYMISHDSMEAAGASWRAFSADPEWQKVFRASRADGALINKVDSIYLNPTDYSPVR